MNEPADYHSARRIANSVHVHGWRDKIPIPILTTNHVKDIGHIKASSILHWNRCDSVFPREFQWNQFGFITIEWKWRSWSSKTDASVQETSAYQIQSRTSNERTRMIVKAPLRRWFNSSWIFWKRHFNSIIIRQSMWSMIWSSVWIYRHRKSPCVIQSRFLQRWFTYVWFDWLGLVPKSSSTVKEEPTERKWNKTSQQKRSKTVRQWNSVGKRLKLERKPCQIAWNVNLGWWDISWFDISIKYLYNSSASPTSNLSSHRSISFQFLSFLLSNGSSATLLSTDVAKFFVTIFSYVIRTAYSFLNFFSVILFLHLHLKLECLKQCLIH